MTISPVEGADLPAIRRIVACAVRHSVAKNEEEAVFLIDDIEQAFQSWEAEPQGKTLLKYEVAGTIAGVILVKDFWNLCVLFVDPDRQRQGIGRALLEAVLPMCRANSPKSKLMLNSSTAGVPFYVALGFTQTGPGIERPGGCIPFEYSFD